MFVRFKTRGHRLHVTLGQTARLHGKVRQKHIASIGSVATNPDPVTAIRDRLRLWQALHAQLGALKLEPQALHKLMTAVHARLPMPSPEETGSVELWEAEHKAKFWTRMNAETQKLIELHRNLIANAESKIAELQADADREAALVDDAKTRAARLTNYPKLD
jgi:hypothetical protein